jgi:pyruvate formate lyase activating enzyme
MLIGGFQKVSLIDYPGKIGSIVFTLGCNFRCGYCHNPELVKLLPKLAVTTPHEIIKYLENRKGYIEAVTVTGGEPTLQKDLIDFLTDIKALGLLVKLDSNGSTPTILDRIIKMGLVDYIAMDIKAPLYRYSDVSNSPIKGEVFQHSIKLILDSGLPHEFRTTIVKSQLSPNDLLEIGQTVQGADLYALQKFVPTKTNDPTFLKETTYSDQEFAQIQNTISPWVKKCIVR